LFNTDDMTQITALVLQALDSGIKVKGKDISVRKITSLLWEITCHVESHSVTCHPAAMTFLPLPQSKLVLDLATPEGCKAELT